MKTYVMLHFEHKNDVTIIIKLHKATHLQLAHSSIQKFDNDHDIIMFEM